MADTLSQALLEASLLSSLSEEDEGSVVIDVDRRTMVLPTGFFFGVYNDKDILKVPFVIPRYYNELDLSEFQITINYINSAGYGNIYRVADAEVTESAIKFKWVTGRGVFVKEGTVRFIVCLRQIGSNGEVEKEFNTTIASANVLKGLEVDENPDPIAYSILAHMEELKDQADAAVEVVEGVSDRIDDAVTEAEQAIAAMYHSPYVAPTAADMLSHDKVYVYTGNETGYTFGNWYYWNGSAFVSGGSYNAMNFVADNTLSIKGAAADAKKTGDEIAELKEDLEQSVRFIEPVASSKYASIASVSQVGTYNIGSSSPSDRPVGVVDATLLVIRNSENWNMQIMFPYTTQAQNGIVAYYRLVNRNNYSIFIDWTKFISDADITSKLTSRFYGKKLSIIGDSIDTFDQTGYKIAGYEMYYPHGSVTSVDQTWWKKVIDASGMTIEKNASSSGSRVTNTAQDAAHPDFYSRVSVIGSPDVIFITLGTNDSNNNVSLGDYDFTTAYRNLSESTFRTAYIKGVKALQATYPNAQIVCITEKMQTAYKESIAYIAKTLGVAYIDASDYVSETGSHPGESGMRQIAALVLYPTDETFTQNHIPADSKAVGDKFAKSLTLKGQISSSKYSSLADVVEPGLYFNDADTASFPDIPSVGSNGYVVVSPRSDNWNLQIYFPTLWRTGYNDKTVYYRVINNKNGSILCDWTPFLNVNEIDDENLVKKVKTCSVDDLTVGVITNGEVNSASADRICTETYFPVSKGDVIVLTKENVWTAVTEYDENKIFVRTDPKYRSMKPQLASDYTYTATTEYRPFVAKQDGYVRMHFRLSTGTVTKEIVAGSFEIISQTDSRNSLAINEYLATSHIQSMKAVRLDSALINGQDGTFVKGKLWSFDDGASAAGNINVIDLDAGTTTIKTHNLGHANSVDYNPNNDYLMMYGANGKNQPTIVLYRDPDSKTDLRKADSNCTIIGLYNSNSFLNCSASVCWGEADCIAYYVTGVYTDGDQTIAPTREIYKLLLGMGSNNLSSNGGFGTYVSGKSDDEYNGTAKILKTYTGEIPFMSTIYSTGNLETPQGMEYDKYIYLGWGFSGHNVLKIALNDDSNTYTVVDNLYVDVLTNAGVSEFYEPEMVALDGAHLYTGSRTGSNKLFLKMRLI